MSRHIDNRGASGGRGGEWIAHTIARRNELRIVAGERRRESSKAEP